MLSGVLLGYGKNTVLWLADIKNNINCLKLHSSLTQSKYVCSPILIVMLCYNIWNNTSTDNILHQPSPLGDWTPPTCDHEFLQMYLFPISFIAQFIISALRAVLLIPGPHFPVPYLSLINLVIPGLGWDGLDQHLNPFPGLLCKHEALIHEKCIVCCLSEMNWLTLYLDTHGSGVWSPFSL